MFYCLAGFVSISDKEKIDNDVIAIRFPIRYTQQPCNFPVGLPKKPKKAKPLGVPFWHFFFLWRFSLVVANQRENCYFLPISDKENIGEIREH